ncbi:MULTISPECIES: arylamine N-acetyltransferase family protein [Salinibaculum]|uniref:arylamine N-acetyltransferase family protein n=1 Tax=Salinibaculum TaxID=2732368 RepID=UPI0030D54A72
MNTADYLARLGVEPAAVDDHSVETLAEIQRAHVTSVPFENLAITGDLLAGEDTPGVSLSLPALYEKIVERERGGFCYELNGLFGWLLAELGFDVERIPAAVLDEEGQVGTPANHHTLVVDLGRRYVVDVGVAVPTLRQPLPLDGTLREDSAGVAWRVAESDRPDADYCTEFRSPGAEWERRFVFRDHPVALDYFAASCRYLSTAPESSFTSGPFATIATDAGHLKLKPETLTVIEGGETREQSLDDGEFHDVLEREFGISLA